MTAHQHYTLACDEPGCSATFTASQRRADLTRAVAVQRGWVHGVTPRRFGGPSRSLDYCPAHAGQLGDLAPKTLAPYVRPLDDVNQLIDASSVGEGLRRVARDGADAEAERAAADLTPEVMAQIARDLAPFLDSDRVASQRRRDPLKCGECGGDYTKCPHFDVRES